ncbi:sensor histidine kinase [Rhabdothermincola salaria]|uniref:sensor histidine kinase n=1 Tax=Rhabdothermincola salaria TaxID=2903142 RepID=UPI001E43B01D|nr:HAMP domain-containing sensor histidine kinase [Rhabdothermincola salaria]MCD9624947.1 HAMP domain-containing histidine kinase [Rhabdothermincola salaria]
MSTSVGPPPGTPPAASTPPVTGEHPQVEVRTRLHSRGVRLADRLPPWAGSVRFRLTLVYSTVVFGLAALVVASIYMGLRYTLENQTVGTIFELPGRPPLLRLDEVALIENRAYERALETLRVWSFGALLGLFFVSLAVGWLVSGRMLRPIGQITATVREIQASDLSRRIDLGGPDDELRRLADTFDEMLGRIDDAFEGQRQFIHEASHELRNPLAVIRTNLEVTLADPDAGADDLRRTAEVVERSTERMSRLVDDLLVYARKGTLSLEREPVDAGLLVADASDEFEAFAQSRGLHLAQSADPGLWVLGDRLALRQALANLLANAVRHSPVGSTIRVRAGREGPWVWLSVEDEGPGIDPADHDRVFQRFWRGDPKEGREQGRSGLGLTIVRQTAEAHGGEVKLASEPGAGAAFALWLPALSTPTPIPGV